MRKLILLFLCSFAAAQVIPSGGGLPTSSIVGQITTSTGGPVKNGTLTFSLSQPAIAAGTSTVVTQATACYTASSGNIVGIPDPIALPVVTTNTATGTLPAGTYYVQTYYVDATSHVSSLSPETAVVLSSTGKITVNAPVLQPAAAVGYGIAISTTSGTETIQGSVTGWTQFVQSTPLVVGSTPIASNNSSCYVWFSDALIPTGTYYTVSLANKNGSLIAGFPQTWCTYGGANGTIDVSQGAPTGNCNTKGVFYPTPIFANPSSGSQSINGSLSLTGTLAYVGAINSTGTINLTNPGVFTDTQIHQYLKSIIGTGSFSTYGAGGTTEAGSFYMSIPSNAVVLEGDSIVGLVQSNCNSAGRTVCNGVALSGHAWANAVGSAVWGQNVTVQDTPGATAANLVGVEIDVGVGQNQSAGWVHGLDIFLSTSAGLTGTMPTGTNGNAITVGKTNGLGIAWANGLNIQPASASTAISIGAACTVGPCSSQSITQAGLDSGSTPHFGTWQVDSSGTNVFTGGLKVGASGSTISDTREIVQSWHSCGSTTTCANTSNMANRGLVGTVALSGGTATVTGISPAFTSTATMFCWGTDITAASAVRVIPASSSSITITGTTTDSVTYACIGN